MNVSTYITTNVAYGSLFSEIGGHTISQSSSSFSFGDVVKFTCNRGWTTCIGGWYVFHANNATYHRTDQLPMYFRTGNQWTTEIEIVMHYNHDVIVVAEMR